MPKKKASYVKKTKSGYIYARVQIKQPDGSYKEFYKPAKSVTHAEELAREMMDDHKDRGQGFVDSKDMRLQDLAKWYKDTYIIEPVYVEGKKVAGIRTWDTERRKIDRIFGIPPADQNGNPVPGFKAVAPFVPNVSVADADEDLFRMFKLARLKTVGIATVNRDLETIRAMLKKAKKKRWIKDVPDFSELHQKSLEDRRTVTITDAEESVILKFAKEFTGSPRLYSLILALRDSGARPNELYPVNDYSDDKTKYEPLRWRDVLVDGEILPVTRVVSYKNKKREERLCVVTDRMKAAFEELWSYLSKAKKIIQEHQAHPDNMIFPYTTFQSGWEVVREKAGLPGLRLRDLRRDWSSRLARLGYSDRLAQRGMGHASLQMTYNYTEFDMQAAMMAKEMLDRDNSRAIEVSDAVN